MEKTATEGELEKLRGLVLKGITGARKLITNAALGALLCNGPLRNSISVQAAKAYYFIKNVHATRLTKESG